MFLRFWAQLIPRRDAQAGQNRVTEREDSLRSALAISVDGGTGSGGWLTLAQQPEEVRDNLCLRCREYSLCMKGQTLRPNRGSTFNA